MAYTARVWQIVHGSHDTNSNLNSTIIILYPLSKLASPRTVSPVFFNACEEKVYIREAGDEAVLNFNWLF